MTNNHNELLHESMRNNYVVAMDSVRLFVGNPGGDNIGQSPIMQVNKGTILLCFGVIKDCPWKDNFALVFAGRHGIMFNYWSPKDGLSPQSAYAFARGFLIRSFKKLESNNENA